jgi:hypothetical protein
MAPGVGFCHLAIERNVRRFGGIRKNKVVRFIIGDEGATGAADATNKADQLEYLIHKIYGVREGYVPISNVRLFSLLFLFDWSCMVRDLSPFTSAMWRMGRVCAYPLDYTFAG